MDFASLSLSSQPAFIKASFKFSPNSAVGIECDSSQLTRRQVSAATSTLQSCDGLICRQRLPRADFEKKATNQYYIRALSTFADTGGSPSGRMYSVAVVGFLLANCGTFINQCGPGGGRFGQDDLQVGRIYSIHPRG
jgi:hypothetical protein